MGAAVAGQGSLPDVAALVATAAYHTIQGALDLLPWRGHWSPDCLPDPDTAVGAACPVSEAACAGAPAARVAEPPRAIRLDSLLPAALIDMAVPLAAVDATLHGADRDFQWHSPVGMESVHAFSRLALGMVPAWSGGAPDRLRVYTDGSSDAGRAGWAFLVLAEFAGSWPGGRHFG